MARLYNTRVLLDPTMIQNVSNVADKRLQNEMELNKRMGDSIRSVLSKGGETLDEYRARKQREELIKDWDIPPELRNDPAFKASYEEYTRTGSSNGISNIILQKEIAKAREAEMLNKKAEDAKSKEWHDAIRLAQARTQYMDIQNKMLAALDSGDYNSANILKSQLDAYETEFGKVFGDDAKSVLESRTETNKAKADKEATIAEDEKWKKEQEKKKADKSYEMRNFILENFMPVGAVKNKDEQIYLANLIRNTDMSDEDKKYLLDRVYGETQQEAVKKSVQGAVAKKAGEKTEKSIDEKESKKKDAEEGRKRIANGLVPTRKQQQAMDEGY